MQFHPANASIEPLILSTFEGKICQHSPISLMVKEHPIELAYALALVSTGDYYSITPPFVCRAKRDCKNPAFFIHATLFRFFIFRFLLIVRKIIFQTTSFQPFSALFQAFFPRIARFLEAHFGVFRKNMGFFEGN